MRKALITFGDDWFELTPSKMTVEERDDLIDLKTEDDDRIRIRKGIQDRCSRPASQEDATAAAGILMSHHGGPFSCATVIVNTGHGFVVHEGGLVRF